MVDKKQLEILREGVAVWNQWRRDNPDMKLDFRDVDLQEADLISADLREANLGGAFLYGVNLSGATLSSANLLKTYLVRAILYSTNLYSANLRKANLYATTLVTANLKKAILIGTNLREADLVGANLRKANLNSANLEYASIREANLDGAVLYNAVLIGLQAQSTNFGSAILTGACIGEWNINSQTNLQDVKCDYIYLKGLYSEEENKWIFSDRRPHDPNKNFAPGEFTQLFQKALETVDLIFSEGIEWTAFLESFQQLQAEVKSEELGIQGIEKKPGGAFVVRLEVPQGANKAEIEKYIRQEYDAKVKVIEASYQKQLQGKDEIIQAKNEELIKAYREKSTDIIELAKNMAKNQPDINISVVSGDSYNTETAGIVHNEKGNISENAKVAGEINEDGQPE